jgi:hypothetical protein
VRHYRDPIHRQPRTKVLVHLGEYPTPEEALREWPHNIARLRENGRERQAARLEEKLAKLKSLMEQEEDRAEKEAKQ